VVGEKGRHLGIGKVGWHFGFKNRVRRFFRKRLRQVSANRRFFSKKSL